MLDLTGAQWRKSSRSDSQGDCVEIADVTPMIALQHSTETNDAQWRKSSRSDQHGGDCVEVAELTPMIAVRDSKNPDGPKLIFDTADWRAFTRRVSGDEYDLR